MIEGNIDRAVSLVTGNIIRAADIAIPKTTGYPTRHCRPWWNDKCKLARKKQQKAWGSLEGILQQQITLLTNRLGQMQEESAEIHKENLGSITSQT